MFIYSEQNGCFRPNYPSYILNRIENNETSQWILNAGIPEKPLIDWARQFMSEDKDFVDIGAHMGTYTISLAPLCKNVHSFEAQRMTYYQLCGGIILNSLENTYAYNVALGSNEESGQYKHLFISTIDGGGSTVSQKVAVRSHIIKEEVVKMKCLDDYKLSNVGFIKIDVEGYEYNVLRGAICTLTQNNFPPILFECWTDEWFQEDKQNVFNLLQSLGYKIVSISNYPNMFLASI